MGKEHPTPEDVEKFKDIMRGMEERREREWREATEFKPGELTPEEERFVREKGLTALNYIPQRTLQRQGEMRASRQEPVAASNLRAEIANRVDGFAYALLVPVILLFACVIARSHGWPIG